MSRSLSIVFGLLAAVCLVAPARLPAADLSLSGDWQYRDSRDDGSEFTENYVVDFAHDVFFTPAMRLEGAVRYNRQVEPENTQDNVSPTLTCELRNEFFQFNASAHANEQFNSDEKDTSNRSVDVNWNSNWAADGFVPAVSVNYNRNWFEDDLHPKAQDTDSTNTGGSLSWDGLPVTGFYSFNWLEDNNHVVGSRYRSYNHLGRLAASGAFWRDKGYVSVTEQYSFTKNENRVKTDASGTALVKVALNAYSATADPADAVTPAANPALTNGDTTDTAVSVNDPADPDRLMIAVRPNYQRVDTVYLYTADALSAADSSQFTWDLYYSDNNLDWTLAQAGVTTSYSATDRRFEIDVSGHTYAFLRLVAADDPAGRQVDFSEIVAYRAESATGATVTVKDDFSLWSTDVNLSLDIRPDLTLTSNLSYEVNDYSASPDLTTTKANAGLRWDITDEVLLDVNASFTLRDREDAAEEEYRTYGLNLTLPLLPTLDSVWGATISEDYEDGEKRNTTYNYNLQLIADLYTDLDSKLDVSYDQNDNELTGERSATTEASLVLTARLVPGLVANYSAEYSKVSGQAEVVDMDVDFHWRRSEYLVLRGAVRQTWESGEDITRLSFGCDLALTGKMQLTLNHGFEFNPERKHVTAIDWRWTINEYFSLLTTGSYENGDEQDEAWSVVSRLNARFAD